MSGACFVSDFSLTGTRIVVSARIYCFDGWTLDMQSGELERAGARTRLQEQPLQVLASLLDAPGQVVTREQLIARLWPNTVVDFDTGLNSAVRKLRAALGDTAETPRYIETLPRRGYRYIGPVEEAGARDASPPAAGAPSRPALEGFFPEPAAPAESHSLTVEPTSGSAPTRPPIVRAGLALALALVIVAALAALLITRVFHSPTNTPTAFAPPPHSLAVLPLINMSGNASEDYLSDGLSEELIHSLSQLKDLRVAAQTSSFSFKGKSVDVETVARQLNVGNILEGSVRRSGNTVRITVQLVDATTGFHAWSQTYDRPLGDALALQSEIANAVASALKVTLLEGANAKGLGGTHNALALDAYLRGLKLAGATLRSGDEVRETIAAFTEAITLDPGFALAYAGRARAYTDFIGYFMIEAGPTAVTNGLADANKAVELAPALGTAHGALAQILELGYLDFRRASDEYARALDLAPGDARVLFAYTRFAASMGRRDFAITLARRNIELDPLNVLAYRALGEALEAARRFPEAIAAFEGAIKLNPGHATEAYQRRGRLYYLVGNYPAAKASCEAEPDRYQAQTCMPLIYEKLGQHELARSALADAIKQQGEYSSFQYAEAYAQWGQLDEAMKWLEVGMRVRDPGMESVKTDALLDPLRGDPRFQALERALNFPQ
jgi:TolB-like protein/DNA-binding winged helix-turn-helix (wHTH) protein/Tfp pilus assembly protein PilF